MVYESIKRNRYFDPSGATTEFDHTSVHHFQDLGSYHAATARMHNANLHDWGIARGLEVSKNIDLRKINVNAGVAVDLKGNLVVLSDNGKGDIGSDPPNNNHTEVPVPVILDVSSRAGQTCYVTIQFAEILRVGEGAGGRFEQVPWIRLQPSDGVGAYEDNGNSIILAVVVIDAAGKITELKEKDPALSFRRRLVGEVIEELHFRCSIKDDSGVKEVIETVLLPVNGGGFQANILGQSALQVFAPAPEKKNTYLTLLNANGQQAIQLDTTTGAGSIRIKNAENQGIGAFESSGDGGGLLRLYNKTGERTAIELFSNSGESGALKLFGADGSVSIELNESGVFTRFLSVKDIAGNSTASISNDGSITTSGSLFVTNGIQTNGFLSADTINARAFGTINTGWINSGTVSTNKPDGQPAVQSFAVDGNRGYIGIFGTDGQQKIWLDGNGQIVATGAIFGDAIYARGVKPFIIDHPQNPTKNIIYAAIEGPEGAAYIRGKSQLICGQSEIEFPEHFILVVNQATITIQLTPRSAESKGLAVVSHSESGFSVRELWQGEGNYEFDYFVAGIRRGLEHFTPVVDKGFNAFGESIDGTISGNSVASPPALMEPILSPQSSSSIEASPAFVIPEDAISNLPMASIISVSSPSPINFADKQP